MVLRIIKAGMLSFFQIIKAIFSINLLHFKFGQNSDGINILLHV